MFKINQRTIRANVSPDQVARQSAIRTSIENSSQKYLDDQGEIVMVLDVEHGNIAQFNEDPHCIAIDCNVTSLDWVCNIGDLILVHVLKITQQGIEGISGPCVIYIPKLSMGADLLIESNHIETIVKSVIQPDYSIVIGSQIVARYVSTSKFTEKMSSGFASIAENWLG